MENTASNHKRVTIHFQPEPWLADYIESLENGLGKILGYKGKTKTELIHEIMESSFKGDKEALLADREERTAFRCPNGNNDVKNLWECKMCMRRSDLTILNEGSRCTLQPETEHKRPDFPLISQMR